MRHIFYILFVFISACGSQFAQEPTEVSYKITPQKNGFLVEISHNADQLGTRIIPDQTAYAAYESLPKTAEYPIRYFIIPKPRDSMIHDTLIDHLNGFFQTVGHGFLACAGADMTTKKSIRITGDAPSDWKFANSFSDDQTEQRFQASCEDLRYALYVGGNKFRLHKTSFGAMAIIGKFDLSDTHFKDALAKNMKLVENFWKANPDPYYFVSIRSVNSPPSGGTAQFQSFQLQLLPQQQEGHVLDRLIAHEYFHHWNGLKIK